MSKFYVWVDDPQTSSSTQTSTEFANEPQRKQGFQANEVISSKKVNTAVRQANLVAVALMEALSPGNTTLDVNSSVTDVANEIKAKLATLHTVVIDDIIYGNLNAVTSNAVYKALQNKLNLIEPTGVQTEFVLIRKDFDGNVQQISLRGVFTPQTQYETFLPVLRGLQGQVKGQTAPLANQTDLDLINRGELTEKLSDKLNASHTASIVYGNTNDGSISEPTEIPYTPNAKDDGESIVSRTYDGYFNVKDPLQDLHPVNKKYANETYEKTPNYVLIEKVITGYTVLETAPEDFTTNYASYYKTNGKARNDIDFNYVALTAAETFETGKYYSKTTEKTNLNRYGKGGKEPDGTPYAFKNIFVNFENSNTMLEVWAAMHFYVGNLGTEAIYYGGIGQGVQTHKSQVNADMQGNAVNIYAMALTSENTATKLQFRKREIISETNPVLDGIRIYSLFPDTIVLIYGARV